SLNGWATSRYVWQTTDGGVNWIQRTDVAIYFSTDIYFIGHNGFIINDNQKLYKTTDNGNNWFVQINSPGLIRNFGWLSNKHGFIMGYSIVYETNDSGVTWNIVNEVTNIGLQKFHAPSNYIGYSIGSKGLIYKYIDSLLVPVELIFFKGEYLNNKVYLSWQTASELNNSGFEIQKSIDNIHWNSIGFVKGKGTTSEINNYCFQDGQIIFPHNYYRLKQIDLGGSFKYSNTMEIRLPESNKFSLYQNFPNPFNSFTEINFEIPFQTEVKIILYDITGKEIKTITNQKYEAGFHSIRTTADELSSGIYFYRMITGSGYTAVNKLIIIK
ncbi:MAG: T9SS type A sorting domain-containing protein, partial [Ignavibacterium sp.]